MPFKDRNKSKRTQSRPLSKKEFRTALEDVTFEQSG
jgi:hypothetical protein